MPTENVTTWAFTGFMGYRRDSPSETYTFPPIGGSALFHKGFGEWPGRFVHYLSTSWAALGSGPHNGADLETFPLVRYG